MPRSPSLPLPRRVTSATVACDMPAALEASTEQKTQAAVVWDTTGSGARALRSIPCSDLSGGWEIESLSHEQALAVRNPKTLAALRTEVQVPPPQETREFSEPHLL